MATSNYPGSLDDYSSLPSSGTPITVSSHYFGPAITNIEAELGTDPAGTFTDVKSRLDDVDDKVITEIDQWQMTADIAGTFAGAITTNWARTSTLFSYKGTGLSESSGIFSFPSTGFYRIIYSAYIIVTGGAGLYAGIALRSTTDNFSSPDLIPTVGYNNSYTSGSYSHVTLDAILRISDIANQKIKFVVESQSLATIVGSTTTKYTGFTSLKIGEL